jgi:hypothetical protein
LGQKDVEELAEVISTLPNYTDEYHISKYLIIDRTSQWLEQKKLDFDARKFSQLCWAG